MVTQEASRVPVCSTCGRELPPRRTSGSGRQKQFCSIECYPSQSAEHRPQPWAEKPQFTHDCARCGKAIPGPSRPKCCSRDCCLEILRRHGKAQARVKRKAYACSVCGREFYKRPTGSKGICCSRQCGFAYMAWQGSIRRQERALAIDRTKRRLERMRKRLLAAAATAARRIRVSMSTVDSTCSVCGRAFERPLFRPGKHTLCSEGCRAISKRRGTKRSRQKHGRKNAERARRRGHAAEPGVGPISVCSRDKWRCQICGASTPRRLRGTTHDRAPEVDHIIPLADPLSPGHVWSNVQCACRKCNIAKGKRARGQLRLI